MKAGPADIKRLDVDETKSIEIKPVDKRVDSPRRIVLSHVLVKTRYWTILRSHGRVPQT